MRLLVLSDSHGHIERMSAAVEQVKPNAIIHLGDHINDARKVHALFPDLTHYMVKGNCDVNAVGEKEQVLMLGGVRVFITHGHSYSVKMGLIAFTYRAQEVGAGIALFGHTHKALVQQVNGMWLMNPGQMGRHDDFLPATFGIITIGNGQIDMQLKRLEGSV